MDIPGNIIITEKPALKRPFMVCGISGWVDGGQSATGSIEYLVGKLGARKFAEIPIDRFHIYQVPGQLLLRPQVRIENGLIKEHKAAQNQFFYWVNPDTDNDVILFLGTEPNLNWEEYAEAILYIAREYSVPRIYLLGGVLDKTPHTREPNVSCVCTSEELKEEMQKYGMQFTSYEGPSRFGTTLLYICQKKRMQMVSITARATYYPEFNIIIAHNPKAIRAVVRRLNGLLNLNQEFSELDTQVDEYERKLGSMASNNSEFRSYVERLEKDYQEIMYEEPLEMSADEAVRIAEELLKRKREE